MKRILILVICLFACSTAFAGTVTAPTSAVVVGTDSNADPITSTAASVLAFLGYPTYAGPYAPIASPTFTGVVTAPTFKGALGNSITFANWSAAWRTASATATTKTTPVSADFFTYWDSVTGGLRQLTWSNLLTALGNVFQAIGNYLGYTTSSGRAVTTPSLAFPSWSSSARSNLGTGAYATISNYAQTIASNTATLGTSAISSGTCASVVTVAGSGIATTDVIDWGFNGDPTGVTGYQASANGMLTIIAYPTSGNANFKICNNTASSITPGAVTLNWKVRR